MSGLYVGESFDDYLKRKGLKTVISPISIAEYERTIDYLTDELFEARRKLEILEGRNENTHERHEEL